jgi:hypothetical protein
MPYLTGPIVPAGAVIDVLVGVSRPRRILLEKHNFAIPQSVHVRALIDTGASVSGFAPRVFTALDVTPVAKTFVLTPSTPPNAPHECDLYHVSLSLVADGSAHQFPDSQVIAADCWLAGEGIEALIGRDILDRCFFQYVGLERKFTLAF